ncbi:MAG: S-layer homology domain-containing protein [Oscillospiraceae bacterium]|jgi:hypothetical protein|nr:S-layer homology domain-containing protein [Oscillospiraceae bacterium]
MKKRLASFTLIFAMLVIFASPAALAASSLSFDGNKSGGEFTSITTLILNINQRYTTVYDADFTGFSVTLGGKSVSTRPIYLSGTFDTYTNSTTIYLPLNNTLTEKGIYTFNITFKGIKLTTTVAIGPDKVPTGSDFSQLRCSTDDLETNIAGLVAHFNGRCARPSIPLFTDFKAEKDGSPIQVSYYVSTMDPVLTSNSTLVSIIFTTPITDRGTYKFSIKFDGVERSVSMRLGGEDPIDEVEEVAVLPPLLPLDLSTADGWAHDHIESAHSKRFLPPEIQGAYTANVTRKEFVYLAMSWLNYVTEMSNEQLVAQYATFPNRTFNDTSDPIILAAGKLDITAGNPDGSFGANTTFNRQQAAMMLTKVLIILGDNTDNAPNFGFADIDTADSWARNAINYVGSYDIMTGKTGGRFAPHDTFTRQESIIVFNKMG